MHHIAHYKVHNDVYENTIVHDCCRAFHKFWHFIQRRHLFKESDGLMLSNRNLIFLISIFIIKICKIEIKIENVVK